MPPSHARQRQKRLKVEEDYPISDNPMTDYPMSGNNPLNYPTEFHNGEANHFQVRVDWRKWTPSQKYVFASFKISSNTFFKFQIKIKVLNNIYKLNI